MMPSIMKKITDGFKQAYDSQNDMFKINSMQKKWKDTFPGTTLDITKWNVVQTGAGMSIGVASNELTIATGTTVNSETIILGKEIFTIPCRVLFGMQISQKIANQEFYLELVSVNKDTGLPDGLNKAAYKISYADHANGSYHSYVVQAGGMSDLSTTQNYINTVVGTYSILELEVFSDECWFHSRQLDSANGRSASFVRHQQIPDPNAYYAVRLRCKNGATAPASSTNFKFQFVNVVDYAELTCEVTAGRGNVAAGQAVGVNVLNSVSIGNTVAATISQGAMINGETAVTLGAGATFTGTSRDAGGTSPTPYSRCRVSVAHLAGNVAGHLVFQQSLDGLNWKETHRIPVPSDGLIKTFDFPWTFRYSRVLFINGSVAQTVMYLQATLIRSDGVTDTNKTLNFLESTTALTASATFNGTALNLGNNHSFISHKASVYANQPGTLYMQQSRDGSIWRNVATYSVTASALLYAEVPILYQYARVSFVNNATANTEFELASTLMM